MSTSSGEHMKKNTPKRKARQTQPEEVRTSPIGRLRELVTAAREKALDAFTRGDKLVFKREGLRIFRRPDGSYRAVERAGYDGPPATDYIDALVEVEMEKEQLASIERMTDEERAELLEEMEAIELMVLMMREAQ